LREYLEAVLNQLKDFQQRQTHEWPIILSRRAQHYEIVGVGLCEPAGEAAESTEMIVASFDPYCGYQNSLGRMKSQEHCTALLMRGVLYVIGGKVNGQASKDVRMFDIEKRRVIKKNLSMTTPRIKPCVVPVNNRIFIIGGLSNDGTLKTWECFDISNDSFNPGESNLRSGRAGAAAVHTEESLVVLGGFELERGWFGKRGANILKTIEILIPKNRKDFPPMLQPRAFHSASCVSQTIIVAGGGEGGHFDVEAYAFTSGRLLDGQWTNVRIASTVDKLRYDSFLFAPTGEVIQVGTEQRQKKTDSSPRTEWSWRPLGKMFDHELYSASSCIYSS
uniref:BACK domain-containing protein n=1 Tax=Mesocestoides corti TaxID=53468 RepID=A0A5K3FRF3_MESCO